ncbi:hypothetical protein V4F39_17110 [Aquincola sp. MAHUQ-54]|uniref:Uncharacterized protein n=1 Tax=Aquincola agrisoli TaxID=3119538 RepID=A0AAW9QFN5_9BURK
MYTPGPKLAQAVSIVGIGLASAAPALAAAEDVGIADAASLPAAAAASPLAPDARDGGGAQALPQGWTESTLVLACGGTACALETLRIAQAQLPAAPEMPAAGSAMAAADEPVLGGWEAPPPEMPVTAALSPQVPGIDAPALRSMKGSLAPIATLEDAGDPAGMPLASTHARRVLTGLHELRAIAPVQEPAGAASSVLPERAPVPVQVASTVDIELEVPVHALRSTLVDIPLELSVDVPLDMLVDILLDTHVDIPLEMAVDIALEVPPAPLPQAEPVAPAVPAASGWVAVGDSRLDRVRGGFSNGNLNISFGIERAVYINGNLVTTTRLNLSELGAISGGSAAPAAPIDTGALTVLQSGPGNVFQPGRLSGNAIGTVIQNTLDNQKIQSITVIDATVNSMQILKGLNLQSSLRSAVTDSLRR